ncbi:C2 domain-containing protein [Forsythia ovata]|uniref:C2 domain-containing protein n=1 Tax=Forsythia ovata TaxID=205694 RepID=A0ABD1VLI0_9LAMI
MEAGKRKRRPTVDLKKPALVNRKKPTRGALEVTEVCSQVICVCCGGGGGGSVRSGGILAVMRVDMKMSGGSDSGGKVLGGDERELVGCTKLKDTEWISRQDPYVSVEYASTKFRTRTCKDGGKNPTFQEKFVFSLIEGLRELNVIVWNSNTVTHDDFIGTGKVQLHKVLSGGFDDGSWPLQTKTGRHAGEVRLIMHYVNANKPGMSYAPSAPPVAAAPVPQVPHFSAPPFGSSYTQSTSNYPAPAPHPSYPPPNSAGYPPTSYYPPQQAGYPSPYTPPPSTYPPPSYPPPAHDPHYYPPGSYPPSYPPPPY